MLNQLKLSSKVSARLITCNSPYSLGLMLISQPTFFFLHPAITSTRVFQAGSEKHCWKSPRSCDCAPYSLKFFPSKQKSRQIGTFYILTFIVLTKDVWSKASASNVWWTRPRYTFRHDVKLADPRSWVPCWGKFYPSKLKSRIQELNWLILFIKHLSNLNFYVYPK